METKFLLGKAHFAQFEYFEGRKRTQIDPEYEITVQRKKQRTLHVGNVRTVDDLNMLPSEINTPSDGKLDIAHDVR